jgi:preprotein translocase subunit SecB
MSEAPEAAAGEPRTPVVRVLAQYVRDISFENPGLLTQPPNAGAPDIELGVDVRVQPGPAEDGVFAVDLRLSAQAKRGESVIFIVELVYSGIVQIKDAREQDVEPILLIECPRLLFPFARRLVADVTREGGHPPLMIDPIDFYTLYRRQKEAQAAQAQQGQPGQAPN